MADANTLKLARDGQGRGVRQRYKAAAPGTPRFNRAVGYGGWRVMRYVHYKEAEPQTP